MKNNFCWVYNVGLNAMRTELRFYQGSQADPEAEWRRLRNLAFCHAEYIFLLYI